MSAAVKRWFFKGAQWWQFWLPQSGPVGGIIVAGVIALLLLALTGCGTGVCAVSGVYEGHATCVPWRD
jgi:hypothetical protein